MKIVGFNGPPYCGKDTLAAMVAEHIFEQTQQTARIDHLSLPLRKIAYVMVGFEGNLYGETYDSFKKCRFPQFGKTGRELMIDVSERFLKPTYGDGVMSKMLLSRNRDYRGVLLVPDSGFQCEMNPLYEALGTRNVYVVRIKREGCTFEGDSREWVNHHDSGCSMDLPNNGTLEDLETEAGRVYGRLVNQMGWKI